MSIMFCSGILMKQQTFPDTFSHALLVTADTTCHSLFFYFAAFFVLLALSVFASHFFGIVINDVVVVNMAEVVDTPTPLPPLKRPSRASIASAGVNDKSHRRFTSVQTYVQELAAGKDKACVITKVLIANNGVAAIKAIRSIRRWAYEVFGDERAIQFVVMATPEDLRCVKLECTNIGALPSLCFNSIPLHSHSIPLTLSILLTFSLSLTAIHPMPCPALPCPDLPPTVPMPSTFAWPMSLLMFLVEATITIMPMSPSLLNLLDCMVFMPSGLDGDTPLRIPSCQTPWPNHTLPSSSLARLVLP